MTSLFAEWDVDVEMHGQRYSVPGRLPRANHVVTGKASLVQNPFEHGAIAKAICMKLLADFTMIESILPVRANGTN